MNKKEVELLQPPLSDQPVETDVAFNAEHKKQHEQSYTRILDAYTTNLEKTLRVKQKYKRYVFWLSFLLLIASCVFFIIMLIRALRYESQVKVLTAIIPAVVSFLTVFIVIPRVITEYLFNADEEKYMSEVIKNIQTYDNGKTPPTF